MRRQRQHPPPVEGRHLGTQRLQQRRHSADIAQPRRIGQRQRLIAEKRGGHQGQTGILGTRDRDLTRQRAATLNNDLIHHNAPLLLLRIGAGLSRPFVVFIGAGLACAGACLCLAAGQIGLECRLQPRIARIGRRFGRSIFRIFRCHG